MSGQVDQNTNLDDQGELVSLGLDSFLDLSETAGPSESPTAAGPTVGAMVESDPEMDVQGVNCRDRPGSEPLTGYELVEDMMRRQDEVLGQLDDLNARVESAIKEISATRKSEIEALESELAQSDQLEQAAKAA